MEESSLVMLCIVLLCVTACLSFWARGYDEWKFLNVTTEHSDSADHLPAPEPLAAVLFIYNIKGKNQVS